MSLIHLGGPSIPKEALALVAKAAGHGEGEKRAVVKPGTKGSFWTVTDESGTKYCIIYVTDRSSKIAKTVSSELPNRICMRWPTQQINHLDSLFKGCNKDD